MSWGFAFYAKNKQAASTSLNDERIVGSQVPGAILAATQHLVAELGGTMGDGKMLFVQSSGHVDSWGGSAVVDVRIANAPIG